VKQFVPRTGSEIWRFFSSEATLEALTPPWLKFTVLGKDTQEMMKGTVISYQLHLRGVPIKWESEIVAWNPEQEFVDAQKRGPYKLWHHRHSFMTMGSGTQVIDFVQFKLPMAPFSVPINQLVRHDVKNLFSYRKEAVKKNLW
jgi:ligand-binding SRPBCC domain-containing protein